jgi:hypothetical protein
MPKDAILPDLAKWFQGRGITCLLYDPCGLGASDGEPRNDVSRSNVNSILRQAQQYLMIACRLMPDGKRNICMMQSRGSSSSLWWTKTELLCGGYALAAMLLYQQPRLSKYRYPEIVVWLCRWRRPAPPKGFLC